MGADVLETVIVFGLVGLLLVATNRWSHHKRALLGDPEPSPPAGTPGPWEAEVLAAKAALAAGSDAPPPVVPASTVLDAVGGQAVLFQQHVPPRRSARSYWGGRPTLPADLEWPTYTDPGGAERALGFLVQVACDEVPAAGRLGIFPDRGTLFVFMELSWGYAWEWRCLYTPDDVSTCPPAEPPATLPPAYDGRATWGWPTDDADWPRLLPQWSFTPVVAGAVDPSVADESEDDPRFWPGRVDVAGLLDTLPGAVVEGGSPEAGHPRPWPGFPHDWRAALICFGRVLRTYEGYAFPGTDPAERARSREQAADWVARARTHAPDDPVPHADADAMWEWLTADWLRAGLSLREAVPEAIEATLVHHPDPMSVLPEEALRIIASRHSLATVYDGRRRANINQTMLAPPTCVQAEADERVGEWLLLLEVSDDPAIAHHLAEGVLQFWIRPADLAARRFDRVELTAEAY